MNTNSRKKVNGSKIKSFKSKSLRIALSKLEINHVFSRLLLFCNWIVNFTYFSANKLKLNFKSAHIPKGIHKGVERCMNALSLVIRAF